MSTSENPELALIAVVAANGVIGRDGDLAFRLPTDMKRFKALTMGHPVVMGRTTFESFRKPLPGRPNLVVSRDPAFKAEGCEVYSDLEAAFDRARLLAQGLGKSSVYVLGGGQIYHQSIEEADVLEITHVESDGVGDTYFPTIDPAIWTRMNEHRPQLDPKDDAPMVFATYRRSQAH